MSTISEIENAISRLPPDAWMEIRRWMDAHAPGSTKTEHSITSFRAMPDFLTRQESLFAGQALSDSQAVLDELRADRI